MPVRAQVYGFFMSVLGLGLLLIALSGCQQGAVTSALSSPAGQLFCRVDTTAGPTVVGIIDATATAGLGGAAPVAILATNATAAVVQADCQAAAAVLGAKGGGPIPPPSVPGSNVAITPTSLSGVDDVDHATALDEQVAALISCRAIKRAPRRPASEFCKGCGDEIPAARRAAVPGTDLCVGCKAETER